MFSLLTNCSNDTMFKMMSCSLGFLLWVIDAAILSSFASRSASDGWAGDGWSAGVSWGGSIRSLEVD